MCSATLGRGSRRATRTTQTRGKTPGMHFGPSRSASPSPPRKAAVVVAVVTAAVEVGVEAGTTTVAAETRVAGTRVVADVEGEAVTTTEHNGPLTTSAVK
jgi:hypothetical protein